MEFIEKNRTAIGAIALIAVLAFLIPQYYDLSLNGLLDRFPQSRPMAAGVLLVLYLIKTVVMVIPLVVLYIAAGILFPTGWGLLITCVCLAAELALGYYIGRRIGADAVVDLIAKNKTVGKFFAKHNSSSQTACFISRMLPLPFDIISLFYGASKMPFWRYMLFSLLGLTPLMVPFVIAGSAIYNPLSPQFLIPLGISALLSVGGFILFKHMDALRIKP